jgi:hypothetical protein
MLNKLDSADLVKQALKEKHKNKNVIVTPIFFIEPYGSSVYKEDIYFYGRLTLGENDSAKRITAKSDEVSIIHLDENSQIELLFQWIDSDLVPMQFIGFRYQLIDK